MLQLQLKSLVPKLSKRTHFLCKLFLFCTVVHAGALIILFFFLNNSTHTLRVSLTNEHDAPIVCVPWIKTVNNTKLPIAKPSPAILAKKNVVANKVPASIQKNNVIAKKVEPVKTEPAKKVQETIIKKPLPALTPQKTTIAAAPAKKIEIKKVEPKKNEKKPEPPTNIPTKKLASLPMQEKIAQKSIIKEALVQEQNNEIIAQQSVEPLIVGREDLAEIELIKSIKTQMQQEWRRPMAMTAQTVCQARIKLHKDGTREVILEQPSPALALNSSIRSFLLSYNFPKQAYGKDIVITF